MRYADDEGMRERLSAFAMLPPVFNEGELRTASGKLLGTIKNVEMFTYDPDGLALAKEAELCANYYVPDRDY